MNKGKIEGNYFVTNDEVNHGMITGSVFIKNNAEFVNHGMLCKDVVIEEGACFYNHGTVNGSISGQGYIETWGIISGTIELNLDVNIHKDAIVNGTTYTEDLRR